MPGTANEEPAKLKRMHGWVPPSPKCSGGGGSLYHCGNGDPMCSRSHPPPSFGVMLVCVRGLIPARKLTRCKVGHCQYHQGTIERCGEDSQSQPVAHSAVGAGGGGSC